MLVAAADRTDSHHTASAAIIREDPCPLVTTAIVLAEAAYLLDRELGPAAESALYTSILDGNLMVEPLGSRDWHRIRELVDTYAESTFGLAWPGSGCVRSTRLARSHRTAS